jgi:hypothetical protein
MSPLPLPVRVAAGLLASAVEQARHLPDQLSELPVTAASRAIQAGMRMQQRVTELAVKGDQVISLFQPVEDTPSWARFDEDDVPSTKPSTTGPDEELAQVVPGPGARRAAKEDGKENGEEDEATVARALAPEPASEATDDSAGQGSAVDDIAHPSSTADYDSAVDDIADHSSAGQDRADGTARNGGPKGAPSAVSQLSDAKSAKAASSPKAAPKALPEYDDLTLPQLRGKLRALSLAQLEELLQHEHANLERAPFVTMLSNRIVTVRSR